MIEKAAPVLQTISKYLEHTENERLVAERVAEIAKEFTEGFKFLGAYPKSVTFFGSSKSKEGDFYYNKARELSGRLVKELGYSVVSGGGPGIMEAADRGAFEAGGDAVGLLIKLPDGQPTNHYIKKSMSFYYFFARKVCLSFGAEVFIFFPGGFGTLDEFFEVITLRQTKKIRDVPIICFGSEYWNDLKKLAKDKLLENKMIEAIDVDLFTVTDDLDEIVETVKKAKVSGEVPFNLL